MADHVPRLCAACGGPLTAERTCTKCGITVHMLTLEAINTIFPYPCDWCGDHAPWYDPDKCRCRTNLDTIRKLLE